MCDKNPIKYKKFFYPSYSIPKDPKIKPFNERKFVCLINSFIKKKHPQELYSKRLEIAKFYNKYFPISFELYGFRGWENKHLKVFKGHAKNKSEILRNHKFCYCLENYDNNYHYISEKISQCIASFCVPIYLGSSNIKDYIPEDVFIDARKFNSIAEIHHFISNMDEKTWGIYIEAIKRFANSETSYLFSNKKHHNLIVDNALEAIEELGLD